jgi:hypothetical protein
VARGLRRDRRDHRGQVFQAARARERRCEEALSWGISRGIVDLFAQHLFLHEIKGIAKANSPN